MEGIEGIAENSDGIIDGSKRISIQFSHSANHFGNVLFELAKF